MTVDRCPAALAALVLAVVVGVNLPGFLRTPLDCDPLLFDLFARDATARGRVLYRDMVENKPPGMFAAHLLVRAALGGSSEALRAVDLAVVGAGCLLLAGFAHPGRPARQLLLAAVLLACYLSTSEWNHVQADVWVVLPLAAALHLRRGRLLATPPAGRLFAGAAAEGLVWGLGVWLKPHLVLVAVAVAVVSWRWAGGGRRVLIDAAGSLAGGLLAGLAGAGLMMGFGMWHPFVAHSLGWAPEYAAADLYVAFGRWVCRAGVLVRLWPWSLAYVLAVPLAAGAVARRADGPTRPLLAAALLAWFAQGWGLQHVFDYVHVGGLLLALALLTAGAGRVGWAAVVGIAVVGHAATFADRLTVWADGVTAQPDGPPDPRLTRLNPMPRFDWADLHRVAEFVRAGGCADGEVGVLTDAALPVYTLTGLAPPSRFYIAQNNLLTFRHHRAEVVAGLSAPGQRLAVVDLAGLRWHPPAGCERGRAADWPLDACLGGWADRVTFRAGRYAVLRLPGADVPAFLRDATDYGEVP